MRKHRIMLASVQDVKDFVAIANKCDFDIDIYYNRMTVDAKSFLGVLSMDLTQALTVEYCGYHKAFEEFLLDHADCTVVA